MVELHPDKASLRFGGRGPGFEHIHIAIVFQNDIVRLTQVTTVDHNVAGKAQAGTTFGPALVEFWQGFGHTQVDASQSFT